MSEITLYEPWPFPDPKKEVEVDPKKLNDIADRLQDDYDKYQMILQNLRTNTSLTTADFGNWDVAQGIASASQQASSGMVQFVTDMLTQYRNAIGAIRASAAEYSNADKKSEATAGSAYAGNGQNTGSTDPWA